jgi:5S rRNA maturation endonuclease (ribonuclease M5)
MDDKGKALLQKLSKEEQRIIVRLAFIHGPIDVKLRSDGDLMVNMPCPDCLKLSRKEFFSRHLGVDIGRKYIKEKQPWCGRCNKTSKPYNLDQLLSMPTLEHRGIKPPASRITICMEGINDNKAGGKPKPPGDVIPVTLLPSNHHAIQYLNSRGFYDMMSLYNQFETSYCYKALEGQYYGRGMLGFDKTPQGRLVFFLKTDGEDKGWQARILEKTDSEGKYYFHPHTQSWYKHSVLVDGVWTPLSGLEELKITKYVIGAGTLSTHTIMGFDAACRHPGDAVIIVEGVLDAAKVGPPAVSMQGKSISDIQVRMITNRYNADGTRKFKRVAVAADNDEAGEYLKERVIHCFQSLGIPVEAVTVPKQYKDIGEMPDREAKELLKDYIWQPTSKVTNH